MRFYYLRSFAYIGENESDVNQDENENQDDSIDDIDGLVPPEATIILPGHQRCAAHTLNLVASCDVNAAMLDSTYKRLSRSIFAKLQAIWNIQNRSSLAADLIKTKLGRYFSVPGATRWNSLYDSTVVFLNLYNSNKADVNLIMDKHKIPRPTLTEIIFLGEYIEVSKIV